MNECPGSYRHGQSKILKAKVIHLDSALKLKNLKWTVSSDKLLYEMTIVFTRWSAYGLEDLFGLSLL